MSKYLFSFVNVVDNPGVGHLNTIYNSMRVQAYFRYGINTLLMFFLSLGSLKASNDSSKIKVVDAYLLGGGYSGNSTVLAIQDYRSYLPQSDILKKDFGNFSSHYLAVENEAAFFNLGIGLKFNGDKGPTMRIGMNLGSGNYISGSYYNETYKHIDTLVSPRTGATTYIDSVHTEAYNFSTNSDMIQLDLACIWRTRNANKMTFFGGFGAFYGGSFNVYTSLNYYSRKRISSDRYNNTSYMPGELKTESESFKNPNHVSFGVYIPFGLDYKLSKTNEFWKHIHFVSEGRIRVQKYNFKGYKSETSMPFNIMFGIRYQF